jgi:H/ACA ribonucleoprotein complex subunit 4
MARIQLGDVSKPSNHGLNPEELTIEQRLASGFILLDKPPGPTSHQIASWVRDLLGLERLGHGGTLDPFATGVLPLMTGKSMKLTKGILKTDKTYIAVLKFAQETNIDSLNEVIDKLTGRIYNVPPEISAVKVQVRTRKIYKFELIENNSKQAIVRIFCEAGTYIRTIARDMGLLLGYNVELKELRRENSGRFNLTDCVTLQEIADAVWLWKECDNSAALEKIIHPTEKLLLDKPYIIVKDSAASALCHGAPLLRPGLIEVSDTLSSGLEVAAFTSKNEIVGIVKMSKGFTEISSESSGEIGKPVMILMEQERYPPQWNK